MTATADMILERRRIRRQVTLWRILAIVAFVIAVIALIPRGGGTSGPYIARVAVEGVILDDPARDRVLEDLVDNENAKALIVYVNSPGGTVAASEALYEGLRKIAETRPVVTVMNEYAASGGYITAIAADHIVARGNTLTGSIGVVSEVPNIAGLMEMLGVEVTRIKSAPLKAEPSLTQTPSPEALRAQEELIDDMFGWFRDLVAERRSLEGTALGIVTDGRAFTGRRALELGLIDALGDQKTAIDWLAEAHEIDSDLPVRTHSWTDPDRPWPLSELGDAAAFLSAPDNFVRPVPRMLAIIR